MKEIPRIGKWTAKAALEAALEAVEDDDPVIIISMSKEDKLMRYWSANATNMEANWMADNAKTDILLGNL